MKLFFKKLLINSLVVFILLLITLSYSYYRYVETRVPCIKFNLFHNNIKSTDTISLILGSSHSFYGLDSKLIGANTFNFASISQSLMEDYTILKHCKNPIRRVIVPMSYFTNWHYLYRTSIAGEKLRTIDYQITYRTNYPTYLTRIDITRFISEIVKNLTKSEKNSFDDFGNLIGTCDSKVNEIKNAKEAFDRHNLDKNFNVLNPYLDSIHTYCAIRKIELFIIAMPFSHEYREYTSKAGFDKFFKEINRKYTMQNCVVFDFRTHFELSNEKRMFRDADHLSFCGRKFFSEYLNNQIKSISYLSNQLQTDNN